MISNLLRKSLVFLLGFGLLGALASPAQAQSISELPYYQDFSDQADPEAPVFPEGWATSGNVALSTWSDRIAGFSMRFPSPTESPMAITPELDAALDFSELRLRFDAHYATAGDAGDSVHVGFISDPEDASTFTLIESFGLERDAVNFVVDLSVYEDGDGRRIAFMAERGGAWNSHYYGNVLIENVNDPLAISSFALIAPPSGADFLVQGSPDFETVIEWEAADLNADGDIIYTWHLDARGGDFSDPIVSLLADDDGTSNQITLTLGQIDELFEANDINVGDILEGDWTVTAEFADVVQFADAPFEISLERGVVQITPEIGSFALLSPPDATELLVEGTPDAEVVITWERPESNVDEDLVFTWHLDLRGGDFSSPVVSIPADDDGNANQITLTLGAIDGVLAANGVDVGVVLEADWTVTAEFDDLVQFADAAFAIDLERGVVAEPAVPFSFTNDARSYAEDFNEYRGSMATLPEFLSVDWDDRIDNPFTGVGDFATSDPDEAYGGFAAFTAGDDDYSFGIRERAPVDLRDGRLFFAFTNNTDEPISKFEVSYDVEAWFIGDRRNRIRLKYDNDPEDPNSFDEDIFSTDNPSSETTPGTKVNGSLAENRTNVSGIVDITALERDGVAFEPLAPGETAYFRWQFSNADGDEGSLRSGLAINNVVITAVSDPEIGTFALLTPPDATELLVEGDPDAEVLITWERPASNVDEDLLFTWHLDLRGGDFSSPVVSIPADDEGNANQITLTVGAIDGVLAANGVDVGDILEADWTVTAEFGDLVQFADAAFAIDLERGVLGPAIVEYATISDMLENAAVGDTAILSNEVIVTFVAPNFRNQHYLSDETGAVVVDDNGNVLSGLSRGDGITGFYFRYGEFNDIAQLVPLENIEPSSSDNDLPYWETTLADLEYVGEPRMMRVENVLFQQDGDFVASRNYGIIDPTVTSTVTFRTHLGDSDVIGQPIPQGVVNLVGIAAQFQGNPQLYATHYDLFEDVDVEIGPFALLSPPDETELLVEGSTLDEVVITWERPTATIDEFLQFTWHLDVRGGDFSDPVVSLQADDNGNANQITLTIEAIDGLLDASGLDVGDVLEADWTVTAEIGTELVFAEAAFGIDLERGVIQPGIPLLPPPDDDRSLLQPFPFVFNMDTEDVDWLDFTFFPFDGAVLHRIENPDPSGLNESDFVLQYEKSAGAQPWAGFIYRLEEPVQLSDESVFRMKLWSPRADIQAIMKLELLTGGGTPDQLADVTQSGEWIELEWDLSGLDRETPWDMVTVILDLDMDNPPQGGELHTWYVDDFALEGVAAPEPPFTTLFQLSAFDENLPEWFGEHTERGMAAYGDNVYVVSRKGGAFVYVLDAETGEIKDSLNTEGVSGGTFVLNDVEVSGDGRVYAGNLAIGDAATFKLYQLHPTNAPRVVLEYAHTANNRLGDKLTIVGNWNDGGLTLYAPDGVSAQVFKFEMNGNGNGNGLFGEPEIIVLDEVEAGASPTVAPLADGRFFWTASGRNVHFFEADGSHIGEISSDIAATSSTALRYIGTEGDDHLLAVYQHGHVSPDGENENARVIRIPDGDLEEAVLEFMTPSMRGAGNPNGTGAVDLVPMEDGEFNLFVLGTNNGIGGYNVTGLDVTFPDYSGDLEIIPLAQARNLENGRVAMVKGIVNSTDFGFGVADYFIQDETGGLNVTDFVQGGAQKGVVVEPGDSIMIMGRMATFNDQRNIEIRTDFGDFDITSRGNPLPEAIVIEGSDMTAESEFQGMRVQLRDMYIIEEDIALWPEDGADQGSGVNIRITSEAEADTFIVRLARNNTAFGEGAGQPLPPAVFHITGTMGQFRQDTQLFPFFADDIVPAAEINWANLQWPPTGDIKEGDEFIVYAQVYVEGLTDVTSTASDDIRAWIGVNSENVAPTAEGWTWIEADFNEDKGNNHEYMADIGAGLTEGTYYYLSRFQLQNFDFVYGGFQGGFWDGENNVSGQLNVAEPTDAELADVPREFGIDQNYPNPFNPATNIRYAVPQTSHVTIRVYNVTGQLVATLVNETRDAGYHNVMFDGSQLASGVYIYRMQAGDFTQTRKLMLIK